MTKEMELAARLLLSETSPKHDVRTAELLAKVEAKGPELSGDTVRSAYWHLVNDGKLHRSGSGVRRSDAK